MKLNSVRVRMFRNILDSTGVTIQPDVTCVVGKNESGKTAFLQALWRLNPARLNPTFSVPDHYPAWLEKRHRLEGQNLDEVQPIEAIFSWELPDQKAVEAKFGPSVAPESGELHLWKTYANKFAWKHGCNEQRAVDNLVSEQKPPKDVAKALKATKSLSELQSTVAEQLKASADVPEAMAALQALKARLQELLGSETFDAVLWKIVKPRVPLFLYFAEYSKLPYTVKINHVLQAGDEKLNESEATARALLRLGGAEQDYLMNPDYERRKRELENVANTLTDDVLKYWTQNKELRVQPEINQRTEQRPDGQHSVLDELKIRIWDSRHSLSLPFDQHSAGFRGSSHSSRRSLNTSIETRRSSFCSTSRPLAFTRRRRPTSCVSSSSG
jgi:hypothetical protein